jgi:hypothetical protein
VRVVCFLATRTPPPRGLSQALVTPDMEVFYGYVSIAEPQDVLTLGKLAGEIEDCLAEDGDGDLLYIQQ